MYKMAVKTMCGVRYGAVKGDETR